MSGERSSPLPDPDDPPGGHTGRVEGAPTDFRSGPGSGEGARAAPSLVALMAVTMFVWILLLAGWLFFPAHGLFGNVELYVILVASAFLCGALALARSIVRAHDHDVRYGPPPGQVVEVSSRPAAPVPYATSLGHPEIVPATPLANQATSEPRQVPSLGRFALVTAAVWLLPLALAAATGRAEALALNLDLFVVAVIGAALILPLAYLVRLWWRIVWFGRPPAPRGKPSAALVGAVAFVASLGVGWFLLGRREMGPERFALGLLVFALFPLPFVLLLYGRPGAR